MLFIEDDNHIVLTESKLCSLPFPEKEAEYNAKYAGK